MTDQSPEGPGGNVIPEGLVAVVWSISLHPGLIITPARVVGIRRSNWKSHCEVYLGPGSKATPSENEAAYSWASKLMPGNEFELSKAVIRSIFFRKPGSFSRGHVRIKTDLDEKFISINYMTSSAGVLRTLSVLVPALVAFADDRLYNEKTGNLLNRDIQEKGLWKV